MIKRLFLFAALCLFSTAAYAQTPVLGNERLTWDQAGTSLPAVQAFEYKVYIDDAVTGTVVTPVTCIGATSPFVCTTPFPASTPGSHTVSVTASAVVNTTRVESLKSAPLPFVLVVAPTAPANVRIS